MSPRSISIITPCLNSAGRLADTVESVLGQSAVADGSMRLQYIVVDGGSSDGTRDLMGRYPGVDFISEPDLGMYDALAKGLAKADGDIVGYLNAGDTYHPRAFEILRDVFSGEEVDWVTGYSVLTNDRLQVTAAWKPPRYRREFIENGTYLAGYPVLGIMQEGTFWSARLNAKIDLGRLRKFRRAGDYDLWLQFAPHAPLHSIMAFLGAFRIHAGQISEDRAAYRDELAGSLRQATWRERLTAYWEFRCNPALRGPLWNFVLPRSPSGIFEYDAASDTWLRR